MVMRCLRSSRSLVISGKYVRIGVSGPGRRPRSMATPTSAEMTLFETDLTLAAPSCACAVEVAFEHDVAAPACEQAVKTRQFARGFQCLCEPA